MSELIATPTRRNTIYFPRPARLTAHISSRLRSPDIELETVRFVAAKYGLDLTSPPQNMPNARRNRNLIVHTNMGKKVFKLYRADWHTETIAYEHSILRALHEMDFPAPRLLVKPSGETQVAKDGKNYCMFDFVNGSNYAWAFLYRPHRMRLMRTARLTLAQLHRNLQGFLPSGSHHLGFVSYQEERVRDLPWHTKKIAELQHRTLRLGNVIETPDAAWLVNNAQNILNDIAALTHSLKAVDLPRTIIHGDFGLHNIIFQDADHATPMDFELARLEWRLSDLVSCLGKLRNRHGNYDMESIAQMLIAYQQENPISDDEWNWFPHVWKHYKLAKAVQYWSSYFETNGPERKLTLAHDAVDQAEWLIQHPSMVAGLRSRMKRDV